MSDNTDCGAMEYRDPRNKLQRFFRKLYPTVHNFGPENPNFPAKDSIHTRVDAHLSFVDRLRVLFSGRVRCVIKTTTENQVGACISKAETYPFPPAWATHETDELYG